MKSSLLLALSLLALSAGAAETTTGALRVAAPALASDASSVVFDRGADAPAAVLRRTSAPVDELRLIEAGVDQLLFAVWREDGYAGDDRERWLSISKDGGREWSRARAVAFDVPMRFGRIAGDGVAPSVPAALTARPGAQLHIVQLEVPSLLALRNRLTTLGVEIVGTLPHNAHLVRVDPDSLAAVQRQSFVRWVLPYHPAYKLEESIRAALMAPNRRAESVQMVLQTLTPGSTEKEQLAVEVTAAGGEVVKLTSNGYLLEANLTMDQIATLVHSDHVAWIEPWSAPEDDMDIAREISGSNYVEMIGGYDGAGLAGEVMDGGIDMDHQDFDGVQYHTAFNEEDHGTATYGIVFGNGDRDGDGEARATGQLPAAQGWFADYSSVPDRYLHTRELALPPIEAVFQSNSWGSARTFFYTALSAEMDDILWQTDVPIFQSQSNAGNQDSRPQAWAKNIISIGGIYHQDTLAKGDDCWCGGASVGPAADGRLKPDLAHFYDATYCTDREPGGYVAGADYANFGGTSGATPISAGIGGLVVQMWADNIYGNNPLGATIFQKRPKAQTLKAILINTAEQYDIVDPMGDMARVNQGWGLPSARQVLDRAPLTQIINETSVLQELQADVWLADVAPGQPEFKVTMVYQDRAGNPAAMIHRINDVTLRVESPSGDVYWGNFGLDVGNWSQLGGSPDTINTVENVFVRNPEPGTWKVEVSADEVVQDVHSETPIVDQDYALIVYGTASALVNCAPLPPAPSGVMAVPSGDNSITVNWAAGAQPRYQVFRSAGGCGGPFELAGEVAAPGTTLVDTMVSGQIPYGYYVRGVDTCPSLDSVCVEATTTGACLFDVEFDGVELTGAAGGSNCAIRVDWSSATGRCPGPVRYNVYRSTNPTFVPDASNRIAECLDSVTHLDGSGLMLGQVYFYVVRAEDLTAAPNGGPCGGREEDNLVRLSASPGVLHATAFEAGFDGWSTVPGTPPATTGDFVVGDPDGTFQGAEPAQPEDDHTPAPGVGCLFSAPNPGGVGAADIDAGEVVALSPPLDATGFTSVSFSAWRWFFVRDLGGDDYFAIDVTNDGGGSWLPLDYLDGTSLANFWTEVALNLETVVPLSNDMRIRVRAADGIGSGNIVEAALDDVVIRSNGMCTTCGADAVLGPASTSECTGATVDLDGTGSRVAGCTGTTTYQWLRDGVAIPAATGPTYMAMETVAGIYTYTVEVGCSTQPGCVDRASHVVRYVDGGGSLIAVGNTGLGFKSGVDVEIAWADPQPGAQGWNLYRSTDKTMNGTATMLPSTAYTDVGALPGPPNLYFYKLVATGCGGAEGPF